MWLHTNFHTTTPFFPSPPISELLTPSATCYYLLGLLFPSELFLCPLKYPCKPTPLKSGPVCSCPCGQHFLKEKSFLKRMQMKKKCFIASELGVVFSAFQQRPSLSLFLCRLKCLGIWLRVKKRDSKWCSHQSRRYGKTYTCIAIDMYVYMIKFKQQKVVNVGDNFGRR